MSVKAEVRDWWNKALLGQQASAHPVFGQRIGIQVDGTAVTLRGRVESADQALEIEREAEALPTVEKVINHLTVTPDEQPYHPQTIIAIFPDEEAARLVEQAVSTWEFHTEGKALVLADPESALPCLQEMARRAEVPEKNVQQYVEAVRHGKALLVDRVPEDDAFRVISALEGTPVEQIHTFPPEPEAWHTEQ